MALSCYIYYRVDTQRIAGAAQLTRALLDAVRTGSAVSGRLLKKRDEPNLWMEVYENIKDFCLFERVLEGAVKELNVTEFLQPGTGRHTECFEE